jgi:lipopolysaccharide transport system permease protein
VFLRDVGQVIGILTTVLMFLAPVFYPLDAIPEEYQVWILANPLTFIIIQSREVLVWGRPPDRYGLSLYMLFSLAVLWAGFWWFQKTRRGFADVL